MGLELKINGYKSKYYKHLHKAYVTTQLIRQALPDGILIIEDRVIRVNK